MKIILKGSGNSIVEFLGCDPTFQKEFEINGVPFQTVKFKKISVGIFKFTIGEQIKEL